MLTAAARPPRDWFGLGSTARRVVIGLVVLGLLLVAAGVVVVVRWEEIRAWADAPAVLEAHRTVEAMTLPAGLVDDPSRSACTPSAPVRCAWTASAARDAVDQLRGALADAGLRPGEVVCDPAELPLVWLGGAPECGAPVRLQGATLWAVATGTTPVGGVPLGRTAAWIQWDIAAMSEPLLDRLRGELDLPGMASPTPDEIAAVVPQRYRTVLAAACGGATGGRLPTASGPTSTASCLPARAPLDVSDLGGDPVPRLVAELADAGLMPLQASGSGNGQVVQALRFLSDGDGSRRGVFVVVIHTDDGFQGAILPW